MTCAEEWNAFHGSSNPIKYCNHSIYIYICSFCKAIHVASDIDWNSWYLLQPCKCSTFRACSTRLGRYQAHQSCPAPEDNRCRSVAEIVAASGKAWKGVRGAVCEVWEWAHLVHGQLLVIVRIYHLQYIILILCPLQ